MFSHLYENEIQYGGIQQTRFCRLSTKISFILLTLLSLAVDELLVSFPLSLFLLLDLDLVMFYRKFSTEIELTARCRTRPEIV